MRLSLSLLLVAVLPLETGCLRRSRFSSHFFSQVTLEFVAPPGTDAMATLQGLLPKDDPSVTLTQQRNTSLYEIGVYDLDRQKAADRANALAIAVRDALNDKSSGKELKIWQRAVPGLHPIR